MMQLALGLGIFGVLGVVIAAVIFVMAAVVGPTIASSWHGGSTPPRLWSRRVLLVSLVLLSGSDILILTHL